MGFPIINVIIGFYIVIGQVGESHSSEVTRSIGNGSSAQPGQFPYVVSIHYCNKHFCGGTILSLRWVLTAGHCVVGNRDVNGLSVIYDVDINKTKTLQVHEAIVHEDYVRFEVTGRMINDIGLLKLKQDIKMNDFVSKVSLNMFYTLFPGGTEATTLGFGGAKTDHYRLMYANITKKNDLYCALLLNDPLKKICTSVGKRDAHICISNSGGPLLINGYQVGIASTVPDRCDYGFLYTRTSAYIGWIYDKTCIGHLSSSKVSQNKRNATALDLPITYYIVNGTDSSEGQFPFMVSVRYNGSHFCGGTIISNKWVLTAGHCIVDYYVSFMTILYGTVHLQNYEHPTENIATVARAITHQRYPGYQNDIGVIELENEIEFNDLVKPILLTRFHTENWGTTGIVLGWGDNKTGYTEPDILQNVEIDVFDSSYCKLAVRDYLNPYLHICAGLVEGGKGTCYGDSGGPLIVNGHQIGIVSWSFKPCATTPGNPEVFTRVSTYIDWIYDKTGIELYKC